MGNSPSSSETNGGTSGIHTQPQVATAGNGIGGRSNKYHTPTSKSKSTLKSKSKSKSKKVNAGAREGRENQEQQPQQPSSAFVAAIGKGIQQRRGNGNDVLLSENIEAQSAPRVGETTAKEEAPKPKKIDLTPFPIYVQVVGLEAPAESESEEVEKTETSSNRAVNPDSEPFLIEVKATDSVRDVKQVYAANNAGIEPRLFLSQPAGGQELLDDTALLHECGIQEDSVLCVPAPQCELTIVWGEETQLNDDPKPRTERDENIKSIDLSVEWNDTVQDLKDKLAAHMVNEEDTAGMELFFEGSVTGWLPNNARWINYVADLHAGDCVLHFVADLAPLSRLEVKTLRGDVMTVQERFKPWMTLGGLKRLFKKRLGTHRPLRLIWRGEPIAVTEKGDNQNILSAGLFGPAWIRLYAVEDQGL